MFYYGELADMALPTHKSDEQGGSQAALRQSTQWLRALLAHSYDALVLTSAEGTPLFASPSIQHILGYTPEEYLALNVAEFTHPDHLEEGIAVFRSIREQPGISLPPQQTRFRHKDGSWRWIEYTATNLLNDQNMAAIVFNFRDITERKQAEETQYLLAAIVSSSDDAIVSKTLDGIITSWNAAAERLFGYTSAEAVGRSITLIIPPDLYHEEVTILQKLRRGERIDHYETVRLRKDGTKVNVSLSISPVRDQQGKIFRAAKIARNITERKKREEQQSFLSEASAILADSLDYQTTLHTIARLTVPRLADWCAIDLVEDSIIKQVAIFHADPQMIALAKQLQYMHQPDLNATVGVPEVIRSGTTIFYPEVTDAMLVATARSEEELTIMRKIGVSSCMMLPLRLGEKSFGAITFSYTQAGRHYTQADVDFAQSVADRASLAIEHARLYRQAKEAREQLEIILQGVADGILVYNRHDQIVYANEAAAHMNGFSSVQAMQEMSLDTIVAQFELIDEHGQPFPLAQLPHRRVLSGEGEAQAIIGYRAPNSDRAENWSLVTTRPVLDEQGQTMLVISILHDVTERLRAEQRKDEFIGMASHELKTPVTSLKGFTTILQRRLNKQGDEQSLSYLNKIERQITRLTSLISELLDISRIQTGKLTFHEEVFDLSLLAREMVENVQQTTQTHLLSLHCTEPVSVLGDRERIGQVIMNLVNNAIKYSPQADRVIISVAREGDQACLNVQDFGIGIAQEHHQHIFERFYQVADPNGHTFPGLGIGLYLSNEIVSRHGGHIDVESASGRGSTFSVSLPLAREQIEPGASHEDSAKAEHL